MGLKTILLPLLFLAACANPLSPGKHRIAKIPEASGICYDTSRNTLFVVSDRGIVFELSTDGKILRKRHLGHYDLEGIACDPGQQMLYAAVEGKDNILLIDTHTLHIKKEVSIKRSFRGEKLLLKDKEYGLEGITLSANGKLLFLSNQSRHKYPRNDPSVIVIVKRDDLKKSKAEISGFIDPRKTDIAGLAYRNGFLYMVSDSKNRLYRYNFKTKKIDLKRKLPKFAQEGITFDDRGNLYLTDDNGAVLKYRTEDFGIR